jgi:iron complex transport system ATP-binding protein
MPLLALEDVTAGYGRVSALHDVTLAIEPGERVALLGRNGSGKTTCLRVAGGILSPQRGRVLVEGRDLASLEPREAARVVSGVAQQEESDLPFLVRDAVALGRLHRLRPWSGPGPEDLAAIEDAIERLGLAALADRPLPALSGGERRRVALARCLAQDARVLLLDEPTAHLDPGHEASLLSTLSALARERGKAVLAAIHDLNLASLFADRVVLLAGGRVVADGAPGDVLTADRVHEAFGARAIVVTHPTAGVPAVLPERP